ncbi:DUF2334 domain-containing protein [Gracilibacillus caseinilyticus]|uniref:DUF2334 domain-containing protein n=1 Tax=Gracilibacillus caseinilyticus TaxID=2932256 RepID=A0ABY4EVG8_9BACI|nr:DUF2334 domain-containing protein [Gracilibacillus caseinilyticus]UOQ48289.1 DUF2334 domain-containing protein [Gracilibacillus caseinilyticus]
MRFAKVCLTLVVLALTYIIFHTPAVRAASTNVLVVYAAENGQMDQYQQLLELQLAHFTRDTAFIASSELTSTDLSNKTHLVYYGHVSEKVDPSTIKLIDDFSGPVLAIGHNAEQLAPFSWLDKESSSLLSLQQASITNNRDKSIEDQEISLFPVTTNTASETIVEVTDQQQFPLIIQQDKTMYVATNQLFSPVSNFFADALHDYFDVDHHDGTQVMLRLEDVNPKLDADKVREIFTYLNEKDIPYLVSVTPVYKNPESEEEIHLSENAKLVAVLQEMQQNGASIILHGYTDQYGFGTTGDGFEFWDKTNNHPVYFPSDSYETLQSKEDFTTPEAYQNYLTERKAFEEAYIREHIENGINELAANNLYPVAFEAPHYAMSQNGYNVVSEYFNTYIGQVQLSDQDWRMMTDVPAVSEPDFLYGMTLLPETIRYVRYDQTDSLQDMEALMNEVSVVRDGVISGFYHPFLGVNGLKKLVTALESKFGPDIGWFDLREHNFSVSIDGTAIISRDQYHTLIDNEETNRKNFFSFTNEWRWQSTLLQAEYYWAIAGLLIITFLLFLAFRRSKRYL